MMTIELYHETDPRYLFVTELPERVTMEDLQERRFGKLMLIPAGGLIVRYPQPGGPMTDWIRPTDDREPVLT
jgi:hypothetical protein